MLSISSGKLDVFQSGTVVHFKNSGGPLEFKFDEPSTGEKIMSFQIVLDNDSQKGENQIRFELADPKTVIIRLVNFDTTGFGAGTKSPIPVGTWNKRELLFGFILYDGKHPDRCTMHYTWYLGKGVES